MRPPMCSLCIEIDHATADNGDGRLGSDPIELALEPLGNRNVIGIEPGHISPARRLEGAVQRGGEPYLFLVAEHDEPLVADSGQQIRRFVG